MTVGLGEWASASASEASLRFHKDRAKVLDEATPRSASRLSEGLSRFREAEQALQPAARGTAALSQAGIFPVPGDPSFELPGTPMAGTVLPPEAAPYLREVAPQWQRWNRGVFPVPGEPTFEPQGRLPSADTTVLERAMQRRWESGGREAMAARRTPIMPGVPFGLGGPLEYAAERFLDPMAAAGLQLAESPAGPVLPGVAELKGVTRGAGQAGIPESYMPTPRSRTFGEAYEGGIVNVFAAAWGSKEEQEKAQAVLEEAGLPRAMAARVVFDPGWMLPGVGLTKVDDVVRLVRLGGRATGAARTRILSNPTLRRFVKAIRSERGGPRMPGAEDVMRLTNDIPATAEIRAQLAKIDAELAKPRVKGRAGLLAERAKLQAQADIDEVLASGLSVEEQFKALETELEGIRIELQNKGVPFRGTQRYGRFVPPEKEMPMGGLTAEERAARPSAAQSAAAREARAEPRYPDLSTKELNARERAYDEFIKNARFEEVPADELVGRARFTPEGEVVREPTYATETELAGVRPRQAELGIGAGDRPVETAGPMFERAAPEEIGFLSTIDAMHRQAPGPRNAMTRIARFKEETGLIPDRAQAEALMGEPRVPGPTPEEVVGGAGVQPGEVSATQPPSPAPPPPEGPPPRKPPAPPAPDPEPPHIPTVREVEAGSKPLPPHIRAQMMGEIEDPRVPLMGWDEFAELWGPRFQENWVTKAQDFLGGVVKPLKRSPQAVATRNAMVMSDLYTGVQKTRMRALLFDWIGRHSNTLGLKQGKYARNVAAREGVAIPKGLEQRLMHIAEHPEKYLPTTEQRAALDELQAIGDHVLQQELRHGIDIEPIVGEYVHRIVTRVPEGMPKPRAGLPGGGLRFPRVRPPHARGRSEVGLENLWGSGYRYADDLESIAARWDTAVDAIANRKTLDTIKDLGIKPSARVSEEVREAARVAREEYKGARATAKKNPTTANKAALAEAETNLVNTRRALRLAAKSAAETQPKVFGRITSPEAAEELARYLDVAGPGAVEEAFRLARANMIMGDLSAMGIQGWYTFWRDTPTWLNASARSLQAFAENPYAFVVRNIDAIERGTRYGAIFPPSEFLLRMGGGITQRFGRLPFVKQTQRSFEWWMFTAQTLRWQAVEGAAKSADELLELAAVLRKQTGVSLMPGLTKVQRRGSQVFFAPKFLAAMLGTLKDAAKAGPAGWEARRTVATAFGGATAAVVAGNIAQGKKPNLSDPDEPGFFGIRVDKGWLYPLGPFQPLVVALYRNGRAAQDLAQGETPRPRDLQAWPRFMESKLNVYEQALLRMAEATGLPLEEIRGQPFRGPAFAERGSATQEATRFGPIGIVQAVEGIRRGAPVTGAEVSGVRTTVQTPYQQVRETWERERGKRGIPDVSFDEAAQRWQIAEQDPVLAPLVEQMYARGEEMDTPGAERAGTAEDVRLRLEESTGLIAEAQRIADGQPGAKADFARAFDEYSDQSVGMNKTVYLDVAREISSEEQEKLQAYYDHLETGRASGKYRDPETGEFDHNAFYAESDRLFDELLPQTRKAMEEDIKSVNPLVRQHEPEYREARRLRSEAYEKPRHQGVSVEEEREAREFRALVDQARDRIAGASLDPGDVTIGQYLAVAEDNGVNAKVAYLAFALRPNSEGEVSLRDPRYTEFLIDNAPKLAPYFPEFYPRRMLPALDPEVREAVIAGG